MFERISVEKSGETWRRIDQEVYTRIYNEKIHEQNEEGSI